MNHITANQQGDPEPAFISSRSPRYSGA
jgi:hypothetical protein